jgi:hypothetical protein
MNEEEINNLIEKLQDEKSKRNKENWHIGKEIPLALIFVIFFQTCGGIWWAATLNSKIDYLNDQILSLQSEKYTKIDASKDLTTINVKIADLDRRVTNLENQQNIKK